MIGSPLLRNTFFLLSFLVSFLVPVVACTSESNSTPSNGSSGSSDNVAAPSSASADCDSVCDHIKECAPDGDLDTCKTNCADLRATCRACLAHSSCSIIEGGECDEVCGSLDSPPPKPKAPAGSSCKPVTFSSGRTGSGTKQGKTGNECNLSGDCISQICVSAELNDTDSQRWCGNKGDCDNPQNDDERCPSGWTCTTVPNFPSADIQKKLCVPPGIEACPPPSN